MRPERATEIRIHAPAKINLVLRVLARRPDGYHDLWSLMQTVSLEDELRVRVRHDSSEIRLHCDNPQLPVDSRNLVHRAATAVLRQAGPQVGVDVHITKRIPLAAGLGGGSSDAAATIVALNQLLGLGWSVEEMAGLGQTLGSDVSFFFQAPTALVQGRGEEVVPVTVTGDRWIVLVNPGFPIETRWAFERLSQTRPGVRPLSERLRALTRAAALTWEEVVPLMENDFEAALDSTYAALGMIKRNLLGHGAEAALLSGSGATVFGIFRDEHRAVQAQGSMSQESGVRAYATRACTGPLSCREDSASKPAPVG